MKRIRRQAISSAVLLAAVLAPTTVIAQRSARNPVFLAVTFKAPQGEPELGIEVAEEVRQRMLRFFPFPPRPGALRVVRQEEINDQLTASGFPADSAITTTGLVHLGRGMGADEAMEGTIRRTAEGVEARARFYVL